MAKLGFREGCLLGVQVCVGWYWDLIVGIQRGGAAM